MKKWMALLLVFLLAGCAPKVWVSVSDSGNNADYSIYRNGKLVCESASYCRIGVSAGEEMILEARKGDIVYGHLFVVGEKNRQDRMNTVENAIKNAGYAKDVRDNFPRSSSQAGVFMDAIFGSMVVTGVFVGSIISANDSDRAPQNLTIQVNAPDSARTFPWNEPITFF